MEGSMPKPCSEDLRERVLEAVLTGASRREATERFEISASSAVIALPAKILARSQSDRAGVQQTEGAAAQGR